MDINVKKIEEWAPNPDAAKNGRGLIAKFGNLKIDNDKTIIWGECAGSGKNPYYTSADFMEPANPVFRCNCPSRQFPCKHALGLMYVYEKGATFNVSDIPEDILSKRQKIEAKIEKKAVEKETIKEKADKPKKVNKTALIKKFDAQLTGIENAQKILNNMVQIGLSSIDAKEKKNINDQIKELGNYYILGVQTAFNNLMLELDYATGDSYALVINQVNYIHALLKKATTYLNERKQNPEGDVEINSAIEEQLGTVWKLLDLMQVGLYEENASLLQLSFYNIDDQARKAFVEIGAWLNLKSGKIYQTKNYRPYKASKFIKEDNSQNKVFDITEIYIYPGDNNPRVRWENGTATEKNITAENINQIHSFAIDSYPEMIQKAKTTIKNPLMDKNPLFIIKLNKFYNSEIHWILEDEQNNKLALANSDISPLDTCQILASLLPHNCNDMSLLVRVQNNIETGIFTVQPLSLITKTHIIKLLY